MAASVVSKVRGGYILTDLTWYLNFDVVERRRSIQRRITMGSSMGHANANAVGNSTQNDFGSPSRSENRAAGRIYKITNSSWVKRLRATFLEQQWEPWTKEGHFDGAQALLSWAARPRGAAPDNEHGARHAPSPDPPGHAPRSGTRNENAGHSAPRISPGMAKNRGKLHSNLSPSQIQANACRRKKTKSSAALEVYYGLSNRVPVLATVHMGSRGWGEVRREN
jgi:hypothetical protein